MASGDSFTITINGKQTHGAVPWGGVDPIVIGAQIVMSLQTIVSRTVNITEAPAVRHDRRVQRRQPVQHRAGDGGAARHAARRSTKTSARTFSGGCATS